MSRRYWVWLVLGAVPLLVYWNSFPGAFHFDDFPLLLENPRVTGESFPWFSFLEQYGGRPLTLLVFSLLYRLFGPNPFPFHLVSVLLHLANVLLFFSLLRRLGCGERWALGSALLFAAHPLLSQTVNYIWAMSVLLMTFWGLLSFRMALDGRRWGALSCLQMAIWSRAEALLFVPLLGLGGKLSRRMLALLAGLNLMALLGGLLRYAPRQWGWSYPDPWQYWWVQPAVFWTYLKWMLWPLGLHVDRQFMPPPLGWILLSLAGGILWFYGACRWRQSRPLLALALFWIPWALLPSLLIPNQDWLNESRAYLPLLGFTLLWGYALASLERRAWGGLLAALLILMGGLTQARNQVWRDDLRLWRDAALKSPYKDRVRYNLGCALIRRGEVEEGCREFEMAVRLNPENDFGYAGLGYCAEIQGAYEEARRLYAQSLQLNPENEYAGLRLQALKGRGDDLPGPPLPGMPGSRPEVDHP